MVKSRHPRRSGLGDCNGLGDLQISPLRQPTEKKSRARTQRATSHLPLWPTGKTEDRRIAAWVRSAERGVSRRPPARKTNDRRGAGCWVLKRQEIWIVYGGRKRGWRIRQKIFGILQLNTPRAPRPHHNKASPFCATPHPLPLYLYTCSTTERNRYDARINK